MARSRNLKPGFFTNDYLAQCEYGARLLFAGLWTIADREGRLEDRPARIKALLFPFDKCNVEKWLVSLGEHGFIIRYEIDGVRFIQIANFHKHQTPHMKEPESIIPAPDLSGTNLSQVLHSTYIGRGNQETVIGNGNSKQTTHANKFVPPTVADVAAYCRERGNDIDAEAFVAFYESKGWKVGTTPMKNWHSAIVTWEKNYRERAKAVSGRNRMAAKDIARDL